MSRERSRQMAPGTCGVRCCLVGTNRRRRRRAVVTCDNKLSDSSRGAKTMTSNDHRTKKAPSMPADYGGQFDCWSRN